MTNGGVAIMARLRLRPAIAVEPVVAVSVPPKHQIALDRSHNTFHVTGGVAINDVHISVPGHMQANKLEGPVHLIADDGWFLTAGGNVRPRHLAPRKVHEVVTLLHDPGTGLWYEA
jgi:hypothetical protein